jgi:hypothetical protein
MSHDGDHFIKLLTENKYAFESNRWIKERFAGEEKVPAFCGINIVNNIILTINSPELA